MWPGNRAVTGKALAWAERPEIATNIADRAKAQYDISEERDKNTRFYGSRGFMLLRNLGEAHPVLGAPPSDQKPP